VDLVTTGTKRSSRMSAIWSLSGGEADIQLIYEYAPRSSGCGACFETISRPPVTPFRRPEFPALLA